MQVSRITRTRNDSSSLCGVSIFGAMHGAVGSATMVPGVIRARMCSRATAWMFRAASASAAVIFDAICMRSATPGPKRGCISVTKRP